MRSKTRRLIASGFLAAGVIVLPAPRASAWVAVGGWHPHVAVYHPAPCYAGVGAAAVAGFAVGHAMASRPVVVAPAPTVIINNPPPVVVAPAAIGTSITVLPAGAHMLTVNGAQ